MIEYEKICKELLDFLPQRTRDIISRRFGIEEGERETLESIGTKYGITRERVRQIEKDGIKRLKKKVENYKKHFKVFEEEVKKSGGLKREDTLISSLAKKQGEENFILFLLTIDDNLFRVSENQEHYSFWMKNEKDFQKAKKVIEDVYKKLKKEKSLLSLEALKEDKDISLKDIASYLEISKKISQNEEELYGLTKWPEINPRGIKDRAYLIFKKVDKPLHFREVAKLLGENANPQTTHNELIKDPRFILVGRGVYALSEWGYMPGEVKEVIRNILTKEGALQKEEIIVRVEEQRIVKKNTIIQNLSNKKYFIRTPDGKYTVA